MEKAHARLVKGAIKTLSDEDSRAFYLVIDGDRRILHVDRKHSDPGRFTGVAKINRHLGLKPNITGPKVDTKANSLAGTVTRQGGTLYFQVKKKKGAGKTDLKKALNKMKGQLGLRAFKLGAPGQTEERKEQLPGWALKVRLKPQLKAFRSSPRTYSDADLEKLRRRLRKYREAFEQNDLSKAEAAVEAEWLRREEIEEQEQIVMEGQEALQSQTERLRATVTGLAPDQAASALDALETLANTLQSQRDRLAQMRG